MSRTFTLTGQWSSVLSADFYPPIELDSRCRYGLGLIGFYSYNSILNVDEKNNMFPYRTSPKESSPTVLLLQPGAYEIDEIHKEIQRNMLIKERVKQKTVGVSEEYKQLFSLHANNNTLKCEMLSKYEIDFTLENTLADLLGFEHKRFAANKIHASTLPVNIMKVRIIRVDCNITSGAYINGEEAHTLFEFDIDVEPGYKLSKEPRNIIYMPVKPEGRQFIDNITLRILDDHGELIDFRGEKIIVKLELKKLS